MASDSPLRPPEDLSTGELITEIMSQVRALVRAQIDLASAEIRADLRAEVAAATGLGIAAIAALAALNLLLVTAVLALSLVLPGWASGLIVTGLVAAFAVIAGLTGWRKRLRNPLLRTRHQIQEDVQWTKEKMA